jgi:uncharacterized protein YqeY
MSIREHVQEDMKQAMKSRDRLRLECLRMVKGALLLKEKGLLTRICAPIRARASSPSNGIGR